MTKTTKGDGMERMAERWLFGDGRYPDQLKSLTRLLRKVAREAVRQERKSLDGMSVSVPVREFGIKVLVTKIEKGRPHEPIKE